MIFAGPMRHVAQHLWRPLSNMVYLQVPSCCWHRPLGWLHVPEIGELMLTQRRPLPPLPCVMLRAVKRRTPVSNVGMAYVVIWRVAWVDSWSVDWWVKTLDRHALSVELQDELSNEIALQEPFCE